MCFSPEEDKETLMLCCMSLYLKAGNCGVADAVMVRFCMHAVVSSDGEMKPDEALKFFSTRFTKWFVS